MATAALDVLREVCKPALLPDAALERVDLTGADPVLPSSFAIGAAAQASLAAAALAASEVGRLRNGLVQRVSVDMVDAAVEARAAFLVDGNAPNVWDPIAGLYPCADGWVRVHTNFAHHRDGVLRLLGLPEGPESSRDAVPSALSRWPAIEFETAAAADGLAVAALRNPGQWEAHPQSAAVATLPLVEISRLDVDAGPLDWKDLPRTARPLEGLRVLEATRILAGPVAGRTLAAYGADVMLVNAPHLPNIDALADTSRGKRSALADLRSSDDRERFVRALSGSHVFLHSYRRGAFEGLGFGADEIARLRPGIVHASLSAYGRLGPWATRRGFDSLVQTASGFNVDEAAAAGVVEPKPLPVQMLDMASGFLLAFGVEAALLRQRAEGGSWQVQVSLARTGQ
ncbi:MAG TPA: CoA transferase, partial [Caldimonas sp.]|nr:CoA transferase [Caldimonas sp.]